MGGDTAVIETTIPEINVTELMQRVQAEARQAKRLSRVRPPSLNGQTPVLPPVAKLPAAPALWIPGVVKSSKERLDALLQTARGKTEVSSRIPKFLRRFFRKQGGYNRTVLESIAALSRTNHDLTRRVAEITTCLGQLHDWLLALHEQSDADANWMKAAAPLLAKISEQENELGVVKVDLESAHASLTELVSNATADEQLDRRVTLLESDLREEGARAQRQMHDLRDALARFDAALKAADSRAEAMINKLGAARSESDQRSQSAEATQRDLQSQLERAVTHLRNLQAQADDQKTELKELQDRLTEKRSLVLGTPDSLQNQVDQAGVHLRNLQAQFDRMGEHLNNLQGFVDKQTAEASAIHLGLERRIDDLAALERKIAEMEERNTNESVFVKGQLSEYGSLFRRLLRDDNGNGSKTPPKKPIPAGALEAKALRDLDSFYFSFENRFRGPRQEIKKRVAFYLPFLQKARAGESSRPVLDLGCGRGEWLELLREKKLEARGVDLNSAMISQCKARRLKVLHGDAVEYLHSLRANSQGGITGFHIIEHLPFEVLMEVFRETRRVLKPGGVAIFESPNCKNLVVGACNFYIDPTHRNPVFPETAEFMLASHGFEKIRIEYLSPVSDVKFAADSNEMAMIKDLLYGPQDFGIIAYKPKAR